MGCTMYNPELTSVFHTTPRGHNLYTENNQAQTVAAAQGRTFFLKYLIMPVSTSERMFLMWNI